MDTSIDSFRTFQEDLDFLTAQGDVQLLRAPSGGVVAVSARYQGRVMTSAVSPDGVSAGYVNRAFIEAGETGTQFDNFGGEDRFWLGPEGGQYGIYFPPGAAFTLDTWQVPQEMQTGTWEVTAQSDTSVTFHWSMAVVNYSGTTYDMEVERTVRLLNADEAETYFGQRIPAGAEYVAFESVNRVTNVGADAWMPESGQPSIWILCMYPPLGTSWVAVPFAGPTSDDVIASYFGDIPPDRLEIREGYALFKADGAYRSKIGVAPANARPILGSFSPAAELLTLVQFDLPEDASRYVNSQWEIQNQPYAGDVVNSYNDGPPGAGGFYEMESSSPALGLAPGDVYTHRHRTLHITGNRDLLDELARDALGTTASEMEAGI
ncbi:MAG: DUF6786 family protein [Rhodothermales bacterium]